MSLILVNNGTGKTVLENSNCSRDFARNKCGAVNVNLFISLQCLNVRTCNIVIKANLVYILDRRRKLNILETESLPFCRACTTNANVETLIVSVMSPGHNM